MPTGFGQSGKLGWKCVIVGFPTVDPSEAGEYGAEATEDYEPGCETAIGGRTWGGEIGFGVGGK
jgi:hypothetical protein